jgi:ATP-dependent DNA helicase RecG
MYNPEYRLISKGQSTLLEKTLSPDAQWLVALKFHRLCVLDLIDQKMFCFGIDGVPVYPLTGNIAQTQMKKWVNTAMDALKNSPLRDNFEKGCLTVLLVEEKVTPA